MARIAIIYGSLAGTGIILAMLAGFALSNSSGFFSSQWFGYLIMLAAFSFIFFGVKRFRDVEQGGVIKFTQALQLGAMMAAIAGVFYVAIWEVYLSITDYAFIDEYVGGILEAKKADGLAGADLEKEIAKYDQFKTSYMNSLKRIPITFLEIFPIGLIVSAVSGAVLRKTDILPAQR